MASLVAPGSVCDIYFLENLGLYPGWQRWLLSEELGVRASVQSKEHRFSSGLCLLRTYGAQLAMSPSRHIQEISLKSHILEPELVLD